jgi:zinc protease
VQIPLALAEPVRQRVESAVALPRVYLAFRIPPYGSPEFYAGDVLAHVLATGKSSRLYRSLVRERKIAQGVVAFSFPIVTGAAMMVLWATAAPGVEAEALEAALWTELQAIAREASPDEVRRAVTGLEARQTIALQQVGERADQISMFTTLFDDPERINTELDEYRGVTAEEVSSFARRYLREQNAATLTYLPRAAREAA